MHLAICWNSSQQSVYSLYHCHLIALLYRKAKYNRDHYVPIPKGSAGRYSGLIKCVERQLELVIMIDTWRRSAGNQRIYTDILGCPRRGYPIASEISLYSSRILRDYTPNILLPSHQIRKDDDIVRSLWRHKDLDEKTYYRVIPIHLSIFAP
jgi:hypothetical protein